jgi:hypothetical protein
MKKLISIIFIVFLVSSCDTNYSGNLDIEGYLMYECGNTDPLGGTTLTFSIDGTDLLTTKTQSNGYFHFTGAYNHKSRSIGNKRIGWSFNGQNGNGFGSIDLISFFPDKLNADTIYKENFTNSVIYLEIDSGSMSMGSDLDTLYILYKFAKHVRDNYPVTIGNGSIYNLKYPGPFTDGQIIDTVITEVFPHVGYEANKNSAYRLAASIYFINDFGTWASSNKTHSSKYPFVRGQPNIACGQYTDVFIKLD